MQSISVNTVLRMDRPKNGLYPVYIRIIVDRDKIDIRVGHNINPADLEPNGQVKTRAVNSWIINAAIQHKMQEIHKLIVFHQINEIPLSYGNFSNLYYKKTDTSNLATFIRTQASQLPITRNRLHSYRSLANHIEDHFPKVTLATCDYSFLMLLQKMFEQKLKFVQNTQSSNMSKLKAILTIAFKRKLIPENPFIHHKIKGYTSNRQFLNKEEVLKIEQYHLSDCTASQKNIAAIFLFLCYTGLRIGDFTSLDFTDIKDGCIDIVQHKTKQRCYVPLNEPALRFLGTDDFTFYKIASAKINLGLKTIRTATGIEKPLTCHVARHTFATLCLQLNISIPTISKMLGHTKIATTMIYAKVLDETKKQEIAKWDGFLGF